MSIQEEINRKTDSFRMKLAIFREPPRLVLYLGRRDMETLESEMLHHLCAKDLSLAGKRAMFAGMPIYIVDEDHHINISVG